MTLPTISGLAPLKINSTVLAIGDLQLPPDVASSAFRHSGNEFASALTIPGAAPRVRFSTPAKPAYDLIGFKALSATTLDIWLSKFGTDGLRSSSTDHTKFALNTSAKALVYIRGLKCTDRGMVMAECEAVLVSLDGSANPLAAPTTGSLPSLAGQPALHTLGPSILNGTGLPGRLSVDVDLGAQVIAGIDGSPGDGLSFPTVAQYLGGNPVINVEHGDPVGLLATGALGYLGAALSSNFVQWFRTYDPTNQVTLTTGFSITAASGRAIPGEFSAPNLAVPKMGFRVEALSSSSTHPLAVGTGTVP